MIVLKLFHLLFLFMWIGTLLSLTRLLGYLPREEEKIQKKQLKLYRRMYLLIDLPSMILAVTFGVSYLVFKGVDMKQGWLHMKLTFAFFLIACDIFLGKMILQAKEGKIGGRGRRFKLFHSVAAFCLIAILVSIYVVKAKIA